MTIRRAWFTVAVGLALLAPVSVALASSTVREEIRRTTDGSAFTIESGRAGWWNTDWRYRVPITAEANGFVRANNVAETSLDFTQLLSAVGESGTLDVNSIRVVEVDAQRVVVDFGVVFQFDAAPGFDASSNAVGRLVWMLAGNTSAGQSRQFHVYFDVTGRGYSPLPFSPLLQLTDAVRHEGPASQIIAGASETQSKKQPLPQLPLPPAGLQIQ